MAALPRIRRFNAVVDDYDGQFVGPLAASGFTRVRDPLATVAQLQSDGVLKKWQIATQDAFDIFEHHRRRTWLFARARHYTEHVPTPYFAVESCILEIQPSADVVPAAIADLLRPGSFLESEDNFGDWRKPVAYSVNGKLLQRPEVTVACEAVYDDELRRQVRGGLAASDEIGRALRQGLWLEHLVVRTIAPFATGSWAGIMAGHFEVDVVAQISGQTIAVECKDTSLGQRDYVVAMAKTSALHADALLLVTTEPLHPNVIGTIEADAERARFNFDWIPTVFWIESDSSQILQAEVAGFGHDLTQHVFKNWVWGDVDKSVGADGFFAV